MKNARRPVGIGPVMSGHDESGPVYYFDLVYEDGGVEKISVARSQGSKVDRVSRLRAITERNQLAMSLREDNLGIVIAHDMTSFTSLVRILCRRTRTDDPNLGAVMAGAITAPTYAEIMPAA